MSNSVLAGVKVLDFSRILAASLASVILSDLGAEVWKIERPGSGDEVRKWVAPMVNGQRCYFLCVNRNKKSIALDLSTPQGQQLFGLDYESLSEQNPRLIYCSLTEYGPTGPYASDPGYDVIAEAVGGFMGTTGPKADPERTEAPEPCKAGVAVTDMMTACQSECEFARNRDKIENFGLYAHGAILLALLQRHKTALANIASNYLDAGVEGRRWSSDHGSIVPYQAFRTKDGRHYVVGAGDALPPARAARTCRLPDYATNRDRVKKRKSLLRILGEKFASNDLNYWRKTIRSEKFPSGPVNTVGEAFAHEQVQHLGLIQDVVHPGYGGVKVTGPPVQYRHMLNEVRGAPPLLGEHTSEVLRKELGLTEDEISKLRRDKVIQ